MIDQEQQRDHAEEAAVRAAADAENRAEQAHAELVTEAVRRLVALGNAAHLDAAATVVRLADEVKLRQAPNVHRYELLARQQHTALLASMVAAAIDDTAEYDLARIAHGVSESYTTTHLTARTVIGRPDLTDRALLAASARVEEVTAEVLHFATQAQADREVEQHEQDLAQQERDSYADRPPVVNREDDPR